MLVKELLLLGNSEDVVRLRCEVVDGGACTFECRGVSITLGGFETGYLDVKIGDTVNITPETMIQNQWYTEGWEFSKVPGYGEPAKLIIKEFDRSKDAYITIETSW